MTRVWNRLDSAVCSLLTLVGWLVAFSFVAESTVSSTSTFLLYTAITQLAPHTLLCIVLHSCANSRAWITVCGMVYVSWLGAATTILVSTWDAWSERDTTPSTSPSVWLSTQVTATVCCWLACVIVSLHRKRRRERAEHFIEDLMLV